MEDNIGRCFYCNSVLDMDKEISLGFHQTCYDQLDKYLASKQTNLSINIDPLNHLEQILNTPLFIIDDLNFNPPVLFYIKIENHNIKEICLRNIQLHLFPEELLNFPDIQRLNLEGNQFSQIPSQINVFDSLEELNLSNCNLVVEDFNIPLPNSLKELNLSKNPFIGIFGNLPPVKHLDISFSVFNLYDINIFRKFEKVTFLDNKVIFPQQIDDFSSFSLNYFGYQLSLAQSLRIECLVDEFLSNRTSALELRKKFASDLSDYKKLDLSDFGVDYFPEIIYEFTELEELNISNFLEISSPAMSNLRNLKKLIAKRYWRGEFMEFPEWITTLSNLEFLDLSESNFTFVPYSIFNLNKLRKFFLTSLIIELSDNESFTPDQLIHFPDMDLTLSEVLIVNAFVTDYSFRSHKSFPIEIKPGFRSDFNYIRKDVFNRIDYFDFSDINLVYFPKFLPNFTYFKFLNMNLQVDTNSFNLTNYYPLKVINYFYNPTQKIFNAAKLFGVIGTLNLAKNDLYSFPNFPEIKLLKILDISYNPILYLPKTREEYGRLEILIFKPFFELKLTYIKSIDKDTLITCYNKRIINYFEFINYFRFLYDILDEDSFSKYVKSNTSTIIDVLGQERINLVNGFIESVNLSNLNLSHIPFSIFNLKKLKFLIMNNNSFNLTNSDNFTSFIDNLINFFIRIYELYGVRFLPENLESTCVLLDKIWDRLFSNFKNDSSIFCLYCKGELKNKSEIKEKAHVECYLQVLRGNSSYGNITFLEINNTHRKKARKPNELFFTNETFDSSIVTQLANLEKVRFENVTIKIPYIKVFEKVTELEVHYSGGNESKLITLDNLNIGQFKNVQVLEINAWHSRHHISLPLDLKKLIKLQRITIDVPAMNEIPEIFESMKELEIFWLKESKIKSLPHSLFNLPCLINLDICSKEYFHIPPLHNLPNLERIVLTFEENEYWRKVVPIEYLPETIPDKVLSFAIRNFYLCNDPLDDRFLYEITQPMIDVYKLLLRILIIDRNYRKKYSVINNMLTCYIEYIPDWIEQCQNLQTIILVDVEPGTEIPESILQINSLKEVYYQNLTGLKMLKEVEILFQKKRQKWLSKEEFKKKYVIRIDTPNN